MRRALVALLCALCCGAAGTAQQPSASLLDDGQPSVTFRTEINFVEVHAIVTDERGAFVRGLGRDDFEILEDGRPQKAAAFSLIDLPIEARAAGAGGALALPEPDIRQARHTFDGRLYIFLLDDLHTDFRRSQQVRDAAKAFVQRYLGPDDLAAVVYTSGRQEAGQELTGSRRLLQAAIDRFQGRKLPSAGLEKLAVHLREQDTGDFFSDESQPSRTNEGAERARQVQDPDDPERGLNARRALQSIEKVSTWMADVQGRRKALLFFSEGLDYDIYQPFGRGSASSLVQDAQQAMAAAQRANVNVYPVDPRGLNQFSGLVDIDGRSDYPQLEFGTYRGALRELLLSQESLLSLADQTGGLAVVNAGDVIGGLGRVVLDNSRYYLLGYYSDSKKWSSKFLKIDVRVKRPGLQVRARRGFLPPNPKAAAKPRALEVNAGTSPALAAALSKPVPIGALPVRVFATPLRGPGQLASVLIALEIDGSALKFQERNGRHSESVEVSIVAADESAEVQGGDRQSFDMNLQPQTYERVSRTGVRMLSRLTMPPGRYQIRVGVHESSGGSLATVPYDLDVPDFARTPFALSGIVITSSSADSFATANPDPELQAILAHAPVVTRTFDRNETLAWFAEAYDNVTMTERTIAFTTSVRKASDGQTVFEARDRRALHAGDGVKGQGLRSELPLAQLAPGAYVLRVEATSVAGASSSREVPFEVR